MRRHSFRPLLAIALAAGAVLPAAAQAQPAAAPGELIVRFAPDADADARRDLRSSAGVELTAALGVSGMQLVEAEPGPATAAAEQLLERSDSVLYAEPNYLRHATLRPSDPLFGSQWAFENIGQSGGLPGADISATEAWDITTGAATTTVAIVDTGVQLSHADLGAAIWTNPGETGAGREANGVDDDGNGLADDWRGWDWVTRDSDPSDGNGHGTHVAGTAGARGNNATGVAGTNWGTRVMALRALNSAGAGTVADVVAAYRYAAGEGARVVNASIGASTPSLAEADAIAAASNTLLVIAAGNGGLDGVGDNNDLSPQYPCSYPLANVVCVAATDRPDRLASFSNYGATTVDLGAPGVDILSTWLGGQYRTLTGTSMAAPHVAGAAALLLAAQPALTTADVRKALLDGVDPVASLSGRVASSGRLNIARSLAVAAPGSAAPASAAGAARRARDLTAPRLLLRTSARQPLRRALSRGVRARVGYTEACTIRLRVLFDARSARHARLARRTLRVGAYRVRLRARDRRVSVRLSRRARTRLGGIRRARVVLAARAVDRAGNARSAKRRVLLAR